MANGANGLVQPGQFIDPQSAAALDAPMIFLEGFPLADGQGTKAALAIGKEVLQRLRQRPLVVLLTQGDSRLP